MKTPVTRFYSIPRVENWSAWARIWITDDGCFTTISDHGNYGYWWGSPGCEFRKFLCGIDDDYLSRKLAGGERELDEKATIRSVKERILRCRRDSYLSKEEARREWCLMKETDWDGEYSRVQWYDATVLSDAAEVLRYRIPMQVQMFVKHLWPPFVAELRRELASEALREAMSPVSSL